MTTISCDHAIYTSVVTKKVTGYQFIAWSPGVTQQDLKIIQSHTTFVRTLPYDASFKSSIRFYRLDSKRHCLTMMVNAGKDSAGRPNRIYSHNFILSQQHLEVLKFNPFRLDPQAFILNDELRGTLEPVEVGLTEERMILDPILDLMDPTDMTSFLNAYLSPQKIVVVEVPGDKDMSELLHALISILPVRARQNFRFSSYSMAPGDRNFKVTVIPENIKVYPSSNVPENFAIIDLVDHRTTPVWEDKTANFSGFLMESIVTEDQGTLSELIDSTNNGPETLYKDLGRWTNYWREYRNITTLPRQEQAPHLYRLGKGIIDLYPAEAMSRLQASFTIFMENGKADELVDAALTIIDLAIKTESGVTTRNTFFDTIWFLWRTQALNALKRFLNLSLRYTELVVPFREFAAQHLTRVQPDLLMSPYFQPYLEIEDIAIEYFKRSKRRDYQVAGHNLAMGLGEHLSRSGADYQTTRNFLVHAEEILDSFEDETKIRHYEKLKSIYNSKGDNKGYYRILWRLGMVYVRQRRMQGLPHLSEALSYIELEGKLKAETMRVVTWLTQQKKQFKNNTQLFLAATPFFETLLKKDLSQREKIPSLEIMMENQGTYINSFHHTQEIRKTLLVNLRTILENIPKGEEKHEMSPAERDFSRKIRRTKGKMIKSMVTAYGKLINNAIDGDVELARQLIKEARDFFVNTPAIGHTPTKILELEMQLEEGKAE